MTATPRTGSSRSCSSQCLPKWSPRQCARSARATNCTPIPGRGPPNTGRNAHAGQPETRPLTALAAVLTSEGRLQAVASEGERTPGTCARISSPKALNEPPTTSQKQRACSAHAHTLRFEEKTNGPNMTATVLLNSLFPFLFCFWGFSDWLGWVPVFLSCIQPTTLILDSGRMLLFVQMADFSSFSLL